MDQGTKNATMAKTIAEAMNPFTAISCGLFRMRRNAMVSGLSHKDNIT